MAQTAIPGKTGNRDPVRLAVAALAEWGVENTGALTLGELIDDIRILEEPIQAWDAVAEIGLTQLTGPASHAAKAVEDWAVTLGTKEQDIFRHLIASRKPSTAELAGTLGKSKDWVWYTRKKIVQQLGQFLETKDGEPLRQRVETVRRVVGVAMDQDEANQALDLHPDTEPHRDLILELAGPYNVENNWLVRAEAGKNDPTDEIVRSAGHCGRINGEMARCRLTAWGLDIDRQMPFLTRDGRVRHSAGKLLRRKDSTPDQAEIALTELGSPVTIQEILSRMGRNVTLHTLSRTMASDERFVRAGPKT